MKIKEKYNKKDVIFEGIKKSLFTGMSESES